MAIICLLTGPLFLGLLFLLVTGQRAEASGGAISIAVIAGGRGAHGRETPLDIIGYVHTVVAVTKGCFSFFPSKAITVCDGAPDIQIQTLLMPQGIGTHVHNLSRVSRFCMGCDDIASINQPTTYSANWPIIVSTKSVFDKPPDVCGWEITGVADIDERDSRVPIPMYENAGWPDIDVGALENSCVPNLPPRNGGEHHGKNTYDQRKDRGDFVMVRLDESVREPIPITPDTIEHGRTFFFITVFCLSLVCVAWLLVWLA